MLDKLLNNLPDVIFFSVGCGTVGYPAAEPFYSWLSSMLEPVFHDKEWLSKQDITVVEKTAENHLPIFNVSASREWVLKECPCLFESEENMRYLVEPDYFVGYTEPEYFQVLNDETRGKLFHLSDCDFVE